MTKILIGKIVSTSGIKGYVRVNTTTESPKDIGSFEIFYDTSGVQYRLNRVISIKGSIAIVELNGISSINEAEKLVGTELFVTRDELEELEDDSYYYVDLIGSKVYIDNEEYGEVVDLVNYGASDIIEIKELKTSKLVMYPFIDDFILAVNLEEKSIVLKEKIAL